MRLAPRLLLGLLWQLVVVIEEHRITFTVAVALFSELLACNVFLFPL